MTLSPCAPKSVTWQRGPSEFKARIRFCVILQTVNFSVTETFKTLNIRPGYSAIFAP